VGTSSVVVPSSVMSMPSSWPDTMVLGFPSSLQEVVCQISWMKGDQYVWISLGARGSHLQCLMILSTTRPSICTQSSLVAAVATCGHSVSMDAEKELAHDKTGRQ
jgi:hypothetical protein